MRRLLVFCLLLPCWLSARGAGHWWHPGAPSSGWMHRDTSRAGCGSVTAIFGTLHTPIRIELIDSGPGSPAMPESGF